MDESLPIADDLRKHKKNHETQLSVLSYSETSKDALYSYFETIHYPYSEGASSKRRLQSRYSKYLDRNPSNSNQPSHLYNLQLSYPLI